MHLGLFQHTAVVKGLALPPSFCGSGEPFNKNLKQATKFLIFFVDLKYTDSNSIICTT